MQGKQGYDPELVPLDSAAILKWYWTLVKHSDSAKVCKVDVCGEPLAHALNQL